MNEKRIPADHRVGVLGFLCSRGGTSVAEISGAVGASESTVRRDLDRLSSEGAIHRSHGGAVVVERATFGPLFEDRRRRQAGEKERIGRHAVTLLEPGRSVIFDSSSTVGTLSRLPLQVTAVTKTCTRPPCST